MAQHFKNHSQVGVVIGVMKGSETYVWSYGERVLGGAEAPTGDTIFEMGSITKTFTATLLANEVLKGNVKLDQRVKTLWPALAGTDAGEITLEQLATHSSGLPRMPDNFAPADPLNPYADYGEDRLLDFLKRFKQEKPGPYPWAYSNLGMGLLGHLITQKLHQQPFAEFVAANLLQPLGMQDTKAALLSSDLAHAAQGYNGFFEPVPFWDLNVLSPAGVLKTTVNDLLKYVRFNLSHDRSGLGAAADLAQLPRAEAENGFKIGLAWEVGKIESHNVITHGGATGGYRANLIFDRENQLGAVVLSNTDISPRCVLAPVFDTECAITVYQTIDSSKQEAFLGKFRSDAIKMGVEVFSENGILGIQPENQSKLRLWASSELEYEIPEAPAKVRFVREANGAVMSFMLTQEGKDYEFRRK